MQRKNRQLLEFVILLVVVMMILGAAGITGVRAETSTRQEISVMLDMPEKPDTLTVISQDIVTDPLAQAVEKFEQEQGIEVEWLEYPSGELWDQLTTSIVGDDTFDVFYFSGSWQAELGAQGMMLPLEDIAPREILAELESRYFQVAIDSLKAHDQLWGLPIVAATMHFFYNEAMLEELGYQEPPATWEEMLEMSREAVEAELASYGFFPGWVSAHEDGMVWFDLMLKLYDGAWMNEERTEFIFNDERGVEALTLMKEILDEGLVPRAALEQSDWDNFHYFLAGDQLFEINWSFIYPFTVNPEMSEIADEVGVALIPGIERESYTVLGPNGFGISPTTRSPEWAFKLMAYLTGEEAARGLLTSQHGSAAAFAELYDDHPEFTVEDYALIEIFGEQMEYAGFRPSTYLTWYSEFRDNIFTPLMHEALLGEIEPQEALDQAQQQAQEILESEGL